MADVIVVHKGDLPSAEQVESQVRGLLNLPGCREVPVIRVSSRTEEGVQELVKRMADFPAGRARRWWLG